MRPHRTPGWLLGLLLPLMTACQGDDTRARAEREAGARSGVAAQTERGGGAERAVSLVPAATDLILAMEAGDRLIARTDFDEHPSLAQLPSVGQGLTPNLEWLVARRPDLVVAWPDNEGRGVVSQLERLGVRVLPVRLESIEEVVAVTRRLGAALGEVRAADSVVTALLARLDSVRAAVAGRPRPSVLYVAGGEPPFVAARGSFIHEIIGVAGGQNAAADLDGAWVQLSVEEIVRRDPDFIVTPSHGDGDVAHTLAAAPGWRDLRAVRTGRLVAVDGALFDRPGPRLGDAAARLAALLHPTTP